VAQLAQKNLSPYDPLPGEAIYDPSKNFKDWVRKNKPDAYYFIFKDDGIPLFLRYSELTNSWRIRLPGTRKHLLEDIVRHFDRQAELADLCVVLDEHPDRIRA
jgi:hypothetical protein